MVYLPNTRYFYLPDTRNDALRLALLRSHWQLAVDFRSRPVSKDCYCCCLQIWLFGISSSPGHFLYQIPQFLNSFPHNNHSNPPSTQPAPIENYIDVGSLAIPTQSPLGSHQKNRNQNAIMNMMASSENAFRSLRLPRAWGREWKVRKGKGWGTCSDLCSWGDAHSCPQGGFGGETRSEESLCSCERYHHCRIGSKRVENTFGWTKSIGKQDSDNTADV